MRSIYQIFLVFTRKTFELWAIQNVFFFLFWQTKEVVNVFLAKEIVVGTHMRKGVAVAYVNAHGT